MKQRVAIIGAGIGREHLWAYEQLPELFEVTVVCDRDQGRAAEIVGDRSIAVSGSVEDVLANPAIDVADICLPPFLHLPIAVQALEAGKHVVCEKPMVASLAEADRLKAAIAASGRHFSPVFQYRFGPGLSQLRALQQAGLTGRALVASIETHWNRDAAYYDNPWRGTWKGEQGGAVLGHAIHAHDLMCAVLGPVKALTAFTDTRVNDIETEDCAALSFQMESGALVTSSLTLGSYNDQSRFRFVFENVTAESGLSPYKPAGQGWTFSARGSADQAEIDRLVAAAPKTALGFQGFLQAFHGRLVGEPEAAAVTFEDGRRSLELVSAIYQAARSKTLVHLPLEDSPLYESWLPEGIEP